MRARVAFLGSPEFAVPSLQALAEQCDIPLVVTQPDRPAGRGQRLEPTAVRRSARALGLPVREWERGARATIEAELRGLDLDLLVVVAFGIILKPSTLAIARRGALNVHASLLPRWRGVAPIERALLAGDTQTGVTLMLIDAGIDTGPLLAARPVTIAEDDTRVSLGSRLAVAGAALLGEHWRSFVEGTLVPVPQPALGASYAPRLEKQEGRMDWSRDAIDLDRQVRALYGWPGAWTRFGDENLKVHAARPEPAGALAPPGTIVDVDGGRVVVACGTGALELLEVQRAGKPRLAATALVHGRVLRAGMRLGVESA
jgi:methionyl-tRNA formyltransferase